jgi:hypothetical protein
MSLTPFLRFPKRRVRSTCSRFLKRSRSSLVKRAGYLQRPETIWKKNGRIWKEMEGNLYICFALRGRLHLRFGCAVRMCSKQSVAMTCVFDVPQNMCPICSMRKCAACRAACVFNVRFYCAILMSIQLHTQKAGFAASCVLGHIFSCTSKLHVIAADRLLHIQTENSKRKCNGPLNLRSSNAFSTVPF